ncbi:MAG: hypothetical protein V7706_07295 [Dietzia psychralcaliphila]
MRGRTAVLAVGAATNASGLLDRRLQLHTLGATVVLGEIHDPTRIDMPALMYHKHRGGAQLFGGVVMSPEISAWVRTGGSGTDVDEAMSVLSDLLPDLRLGEARTRPCLVCATSTSHPYIDQADERTVLAIEGERGVMAADEIGRLSAGLAATGRWTDPLPRSVFRARWEDHLPS